MVLLQVETKEKPEQGGWQVAGGASDNYRAPETPDSSITPHPSATENFSESEGLGSSSLCTSGVTVTVLPLPLIPFVWVRLELGCIHYPVRGLAFSSLADAGCFWADLTV